MALISGKINLYELSTKSVRSPSLSQSSSVSSLDTNGLRRKARFDDRSATKISLALKSYRNESIKSKDSSVKSQNTEAIEMEQRRMFSWSPLKKINELIMSSKFEQGSVTHVISNSIYIAVATIKSNIVIFNYKQTIEVILKVGTGDEDTNNDITRGDEITSMAFSSDSTFFVAGYKDGVIRVWNMNSNRSSSIPSLVTPFFTIYPISTNTTSSEGHFLNTAITFIDFVQLRNYQIISIDESGMVLYHKISTKLINKYVKSERLLGFGNSIRNDDTKSKILNFGALPLGSSHQITDEMGVISIMTLDALIIVSTTSINDPGMSNVLPQFKINSRSKDPSSIQSESLSFSAMNWFPCVDTSNGISNAKLAYSWNSLLGIVELDNRILPQNLIHIVHEARDKDKAVPKLPFRKTCKWTCTDANIIDLKWASSEVLCVFTQNPGGIVVMKTFYYDGSSLTQIAQDELGDGIKEIKTTKQSLLVLKNSGLYLGRQLSWADILLEKVSKLKYVEALSIADEFYQTTSKGKLTAVGLPVNRAKRTKVLRPYLIDIMKESIPHLLVQNDDHEKNLKIYFNIITYVGSANILEDLLEAVNNDEVFFGVLESYLLFDIIQALPPAVLKRLVEYYASNEKGELLTEILCTLDINSLDIDLTIQLCKKHKLRDCLIYIWNSLLNDYESPLIDFIGDFRDPNFADSEDGLKAYAYMSYILTGRQYPTDKYIQREEMNAIRSVCDILFSSSAIERNGKVVPAANNHTIFPYLYTFLEANSFQMLSTLNEFFESSFLNEDARYNRQYLIEALLDLFDANESNFTSFDKCQLAIFIARNYPKYSQLIRLSESTLDKVINALCQNLDDSIVEDCELALESLVSQYLPEDETFIEKLQLVKFYNVLGDIFNSEGKYSRALEMWLLKNDNDAKVSRDDEHITQLMNLIENSFTKTKNANEKINIIKVLKGNFAKFVRLDYDSTFFNLINKFAPKLHTEILNVNNDDDKKNKNDSGNDDDSIVVYQYITKLFSLSGYEPDPSIITQYIKLLIKFDKMSVFEFINHWKAHIVSNGNYQEILQLLRDNSIINGEACLFAFQSEFEAAVSCILNHLENFPEPTTKSNQFADLLGYCMDICESPETYNVHVEDGVTLNEQLWLKVIYTLVDMASSREGDARKTINLFIHDCFRKVSEHKLNYSKGGSGEKSFLTIFNRFLQQYSHNKDNDDDDNDTTSNNNNNIRVKSATLSNIRGVLQEVFISYSYESEMLKISLKMLNDDVYKTMLVIRNNRLRGLILKAAQACASCGKIMGGEEGEDGGLSSATYEQHILAWEDRERNKLPMSQPMDKKNGKDDIEARFHSLKLLYFECGHSYHSTCLKKLSKTKTCIICD
ncbi:VPS8 [Candida oxycetoniae]|uniref:VPS8 n=1 Tax=Candida oxycetoniae TaxID=497107 RepID=A0AAI9SSV8_9ASCO|nr:VPS8 [Candida oxycetoniae]KAI3402517.2 VPS8 [Candida oxycetoniae]